METGKKVREVSNDASVAHVHLSPDGRSAVFGTWVGVNVCGTSKPAASRAYEGRSDRFLGGVFTRDARYVLGTGNDKSPPGRRGDVGTRRLVASEDLKTALGAF